MNTHYGRSSVIVIKRNPHKYWVFRSQKQYIALITFQFSIYGVFINNLVLIILNEQTTLFRRPKNKIYHNTLHKCFRFLVLLNQFRI